MSSHTTVLDPPAAATCPSCGGTLSPDKPVCSACQGSVHARGTRHPAAKAIIGVAWFCTAVVTLWFFGSLAMAPWEGAARTGLMPLPGGAHLDLTLGVGATAQCAVKVERGGTTSEVVIMRGACDRFAARRWLAANGELPQFQGGAVGMPYTIPPPPAAGKRATITRVVVSCLFTVAAGLIGACLVVGSVALAAKLMRPAK